MYNVIKKDSIDQVLSIGGPELLLKLIDMFKDTIGARLDGADDALVNERMDDIHRELHSIRSSAGNLGAEELVAVCLEVERAIKEGRSLDWETKLKQIRDLHLQAHNELVDIGVALTREQ